MNHNDHDKSCCKDKKKEKKKRIDYFLWATFVVLVLAYVYSYVGGLGFFTNEATSVFSDSIYELMNKMAWGLLLGIVFVGLLKHMPREFLAGVLGRGGTFSGILRATGAGILLDLCSHGVLLVGMQLYKKGASLGQTMAFLIASPWNSLSLTFVLWALIGFWWTLIFLLVSMVIGIVSGLFFDYLVRRGKLPKNTNTLDLPKNFSLKKEAKELLKNVSVRPRALVRVVVDGLLGSRMILRWIFFGVILASLIRTFISPEHFATYFGPSVVGLALTILVATILEVCSEGSTPIAADLLTRAGAPGNSFAFLMTGVSTDYTEILSLKETTGSWKTAFFLPLITLPQVIIIAWIINQIGVG